MTQGKMMLLIVLCVGLIVVIGEIIYQCKHSRFKKDKNLSDFERCLLDNRENCYYSSAMILITSLCIVLVLWAIKVGLSTPIE